MAAAAACGAFQEEFRECAQLYPVVRGADGAAPVCAACGVAVGFHARRPAAPAAAAAAAASASGDAAPEAFETYSAVARRLEELMDGVVDEAVARGRVPGGLPWKAPRLRMKRVSPKYGNLCSPGVLACAHAHAKSREEAPLLAAEWARALRDVAYATHPRLAEWLSIGVAEGGHVNFRLVDRELASSLMMNSARASGGIVQVAAGSPEAAAAAASAPADDGFRFAALGTIRSCFAEKHGTPRQGAVVPAARGTMTLRPGVNAEALEGLGEFSHVWLVFVFHVNNTNGAFSAKVRPPRLRGGKVGAYACRTPHRLNPIGLTVARLDAVRGTTLHLSGLDLVNGTPVLDVKPYHPNDTVPDAELRLPRWLREAPYAPLEVEWAAAAAAQLAAAVATGTLEFYDAEEDARAVVAEVIAADPRTQQSRDKHPPGALYGVMVDRLDVAFRVRGSRATVEAVDLWDGASYRAPLRTKEWLARLEREHGLVPGAEE